MGAGVRARAQRSAGQGEPAAVFSTKRACPYCGTGFPELDPRLFSFNSRHGWCKSCFGTGLTLAEFDAEQSGEESQWRETDASSGAAPEACPDCAGERLNPVARHVLFRGRSIAELTAPAGRRSSPPRCADSSWRGREREIARDLLAELGSAHRVPVRRRSRLSAARPRRADAVRRRGAAHPAGGAARLEPAGRLLRARRAHHRPAPARQPGAARHPRSAAPPRATRWSWWSTTRIRSAAPITSSTWARARAHAAAVWWRRAPRPSSRA